jgi:hypothetical protein
MGTKINDLPPVAAPAGTDGLQISHYVEYIY